MTGPRFDSDAVWNADHREALHRRKIRRGVLYGCSLSVLLWGALLVWWL